MNKIITLLQSLKIFWDVTLEYWYTILLTILLTLALAALVIWWIKKCQPHKWLARVLIKTIKWLGLRTVILVETIVKKLVGAKTASRKNITSKDTDCLASRGDYHRSWYCFGVWR